MIRVIDLKQYSYCPRILYYQLVLPDVRPTTYKMEAGIAAHTREEKREKRRSLRTYGIENADIQFNVAIQNESLGLSGEIDMLIDTGDELIPVDYKLAKKSGKHFKLQLMAYGSLLEAQSGRPVKRGFLYLIPLKKAVEVRFTRHLRRQLVQAMEAIQHIDTKQIPPPPTDQKARCIDCEFRRFCNDSL